MPNIKKLSSIALLSVASLPVHAASFEFENFNLEWDTVFAAGVQYRIQDRKKHISRGSSGLDGSLDNLPGLIDNAFIINSNDGNNNFDKGFTSQRVSVLSEADFNFGEWGVFVRGKFWHDFIYGQSTDMTQEAWLENNANPVFGDNGGFNTTYGHHNPGAAKYAEDGKRLLDFFWYGKFNLFDREVSVRVGRQVISWGEALLSGGGIAMATSHVDAHIRNQPGFDLKELFLPTNAIFIQTALTDTINLEAYYQTEWHPAFIDPSGSYFSEFDSIGMGGNTFTFVSGNEEQILGKDLMFGSGAGNTYDIMSTYGYGKGQLRDCLENSLCADAINVAGTDYNNDPIYSENLDKLLVFLPTTCNQSSNNVEKRRCQGLVSKKVRVDEASDKGQFGIALNFFMENGDELGLYFVNYHEKIPNFILPIDAIETMAPVIDLLVRVADSDCYFGRPDAAPTCGAGLAAQGGFKGINDLSGKLSLPQINALLLFLSALPEDSGTIGSITYDLVRDPRSIFNDNTPAISEALANDPLAAALLTAVSASAVNLVLQQFGFSTNTEVRSINYRLEYAENVRLLGATYSTIVGSANVATEITYRDNTPVMSADVPRTPQRARMINWHLNMLQVFEPVELWGIRLWDFSSFLAESVVWYLPGKLAYDESGQDNLNKDRLAVQNTPSGIGASLFWSLEYHNVFTGWDIMVPIYMNWGIDGAFFSNGYRDGQVTFATGLTFKHLSGIEVGMGMTRFFGDSDDIFQMLTQDRDNITAHFKYGF